MARTAAAAEAGTTAVAASGLRCLAAGDETRVAASAAQEDTGSTRSAEAVQELLLVRLRKAEAVKVGDGTGAAVLRDGASGARDPTAESSRGNSPRERSASGAG